MLNKQRVNFGKTNKVGAFFAGAESPAGGASLGSWTSPAGDHVALAEIENTWHGEKNGEIWENHGDNMGKS
jgi:hypothetical protein